MTDGITFLNKTQTRKTSLLLEEHFIQTVVGAQSRVPQPQTGRLCAGVQQVHADKISSNMHQ